MPWRAVSCIWTNTEPFGRLYLSAFSMTFIKICFRCSAFPISFLCCTPVSSSFIWMPFSSAWGERIAMQSSSVSWRSNGSSTAAAGLPLSSLLTCRTSFTRDSKCPVDTRIFLRHVSCCPASFWLLSMIASIPRIPLIGVRRSWDMRERNSLFAEFARRTFSNSSIIAWSCFFLAIVISVISWWYPFREKPGFLNVLSGTPPQRT